MVTRAVHEARDRWARWALLVGLSVFVTAGCSNDGAGEPAAEVAATAAPVPADSASPSPTPSVARPSPAATPAPPGIAAMRSVRLAFEPVAVVARPTAVVEHDGSLYITELAGLVRVVRDGTLSPTPFLDLSGDVGVQGEGGLLGIAFAPDGAHVYVSYTNKEQDSRVVEYAVDGALADPASRRELLAVDQPEITHNGGGIAFGPDGMLWIGLGDGGHSRQFARNAQDATSLLGAMLRIDPRPSARAPYTVPPDNPFVGRAGSRPEIWAKGLRNPWRWSFDREGRLWIGDVGEADREEITVLDLERDAGANLAWPAYEGSRRYLSEVAPPPGARMPTIEYAHADDLCSVVGGYVYRGSAVPQLRGAYIYADTCQAKLRAASVLGGTVTAAHVYDQPAVAERTLVSLGEDSAGELYVISIDGPVHRVVPG